MPNIFDLPMGLGDHLHELRRRLIWPLITIGVVFVVAFGFEGKLKEMTVWPLRKAIHIIGFQTAHQLNLVADQKAYDEILIHPSRMLVVMSVEESTTTAVTVSGAAGIAVALPVLLYNIWQFVVVGLTSKERRLAFLFLPLGVILFYTGAVVGYFLGLPYFYAWLLQFTAGDPTAVYMLRQSSYISFFFTWTISFGLIMDIPWLVMVLVRTGLVTPQVIAKARKYVIFGNIVLTCCLCPATDLFSLSAMFLPIQLLFEVGLFASRFMVPKKAVPLIVPQAPDDG